MGALSRFSCAALMLLAAPVARAELHSASQLTCLVDSGEVLASEADPAVGEGGFDFEPLASRRSGRDSRLRLVSAYEMPGYLPGVTTAAALRLELELSSSSLASLRDAGSWLGVGWQRGRLRSELRAYPFDTDYVRLGYLHALDWGGTDAARGESVFVQQEGGVPGVEMSLDWARAHIGLAAKWTGQDPGPLRSERRWGALLRGRFDLLSAVRLDVGLGYFQRTARRELGRSYVEGASVRLVWHRGIAEPELSAEPFRPPALRDEAERLEAPVAPGAALAIEGVTLVRRARDLAAPERTALEAAPAAALYGSFRSHAVALHGALSWRSLGFVMRNSEGLLEASSLPARALAQSELAAWLGASTTVLPWRFVPSLELGCLLPAAVQTQGAVPGVAQTFVVRGPMQVEALPVGAARLPIVAARVGMRLQLSEAFALGLFVQYERDANRVRLQSRAGAAERTFADPNGLRGLAAAWSRF